MAVVDTSAAFALLDADDRHHDDAVRVWDASAVDDFIIHGYVVTETLALLRARLGWEAVVAFVDDVLPALRTEMVTREVHDAALAEYRSIGGGTSFVDRVTIAFARAQQIDRVFAYDPDLEAAGLKRCV